ncbi:MAG: hypothetical protein CL583_18485 [Alteromonadaceae bacterium]|nr:hypothetical protein [Alteromonadaceae bacterium]|tara:strand:+ start:253 stop:624 length:372 start_codon:yes stop_codon:yes gene_type:complete
MSNYEHDEPRTEQPRLKRRFRPDHLVGWLDLIGHAVKETAPRIHRTHLQIADTVFRSVEALAPNRPAVKITRSMHHLIANVAYSSVAYGGAGLSHLARHRYQPVTDEREIFELAPPHLSAPRD